jgi:phenylacetate-CoA ligase
MSIVKKLYLKSPYWVQNIMCSLKGYFICKRRYNKSFYRELDRYEKGSYIPKDCLRNFLVDIKEVPYYKTQYAKYGVNLQSDDIYAELKKLPIMYRKDVIDNHSLIINTRFKGKTIQLGSSGTTATALVFPCSVERETKQWAVWWRYRRWHGIDLDTWCGWFGGQVIVPINQMKAPFWRINKPGRQVMFSAFHMTPETINYYYKEIVDRKLMWLHGHAHNTTYLASLIVEKGLPPITCVKTITTGADSLFDWQRTIMKQAFPNASIFQHYGLTEGVANISENEYGELKIDDDFGYVEFIPIDERDKSLCRIVATGYNNQPFPLVRYDTGDLATISYDENGIPIIHQIDGRTTECIKLPDGRRISSTSMTNFEFTTKVKEVQFYQKDLYNIYVRIVKRSDYDEEEEKKVIACVSERLPVNVNVHVEYVEAIEKTKSGKIKYIISEL